MGRNDVFESYIKEGIGSAKNGLTKCKCGCSVPYKNFNKYDWGICERCGCKVEKPKKSFKKKLLSILIRSDENG